MSNEEIVNKETLRRQEEQRKLNRSKSNRKYYLTKTKPKLEREKAAKQLKFLQSPEFHNRLSTAMSPVQRDLALRCIQGIFDHLGSTQQNQLASVEIAQESAKVAQETAKAAQKTAQVGCREMNNAYEKCVSEVGGIARALINSPIAQYSDKESFEEEEEIQFPDETITEPPEEEEDDDRKPAAVVFETAGRTFDGHRRHHHHHHRHHQPVVDTAIPTTSFSAQRPAVAAAAVPPIFEKQPVDRKRKLVDDDRPSKRFKS